MDWRQTLSFLQKQFESLALNIDNIYHLMVEAADDEREFLSGPSWFDPYSHGATVDGKWACCTFRGLPNVPTGFREPKEGEQFGDDVKVIRDRSGVVRAVPVPMKLRQGYFCGRSSEEVTKFDALGNAVAKALSDAKDLSNHFLYREMADIFRRPRGGIRYAFGEVDMVPDHFISQGWACGVLIFENGVLIDSPISEMAPSADSWLLFLHRLGWRKEPGCPIVARRTCWHGNTEVSLDMLHHSTPKEIGFVGEAAESLTGESFYSVIGGKDAPMDICLASVFAIQLILTELSTKQESKQAEVLYLNESWYQKSLPEVASCSEKAIENLRPKAAILVATETERIAVLKRMSPPTGVETVQQVHLGSNTYFVGQLGATEVVLCMSAMGSLGRDSSMTKTSEVVEDWSVKAVIMVGIAFGRDSEKQSIGDVLVSDRVFSYEPERRSDHKQERGESPLAGPLLLDRFRNVIGWKFTDPDGVACNFQVGPILSGEKLVDDPEFKQELFERYPKAIGGEMEGAGVASSCERKKCEWIVAKAICDWGDGKKSKEHQAFAASSAVSLVEHVLNQAGSLSALG